MKTVNLQNFQLQTLNYTRNVCKYDHENKTVSQHSKIFSDTAAKTGFTLKLQQKSIYHSL